MPPPVCCATPPCGVDAPAAGERAGAQGLQVLTGIRLSEPLFAAGFGIKPAPSVAAGDLKTSLTLPAAPNCMTRADIRYGISSLKVNIMKRKEIEARAGSTSCPATNRRRDQKMGLSERVEALSACQDLLIPDA
jgi:hypothetical protein